MMVSSLPWARRGNHALVECESNRSIPLRGVPQIPEDVRATIEQLGESAVTTEQEERSNAIIWGAATLEIRRRHEAAKAGIDLDQYLGRSAEQSAA